MRSANVVRDSGFAKFRIQNAECRMIEAYGLSKGFLDFTSFRSE